MTEQGHDTETIGAAIRASAASVHAPDALRARLAAQRRGAHRPRRVLGLPTPALAALGAALAAAVLFLALPGGSPGTPSVAQAAALALRAPSTPAPVEDPHHPRLLRASMQGVRFPQWEYAFGLAPAGARRDRLAGHPALTVTYGDRLASRVGYTIVGGRALPVPAGARTVVRRGVSYAVLRVHGATVVTWRRAGRTCVLAARHAAAARLLALASWRARG